MSDAVLGPFGWKRPDTFLKVDFRPPHFTNLVTSGSGQYQQLDQRSCRKAELVDRDPDSPKFIIRENPIPSRFLGLPAQPGRRVDFDDFALDRPGEHSMDRCLNAVG